MQGMRRPITPMGMSVLRRGTDNWLEAFGFGPSRGFMVDIAGRMFLDLTGMIRDRRMRSRLPRPRPPLQRPNPRLAPTRRFTASSIPTATGSKPAITVLSFNRARRRNPATGDRTRMATGFTPTRAGPGSRMSHSAGPPTTTAAGFGCAASVGFGFRANNGRPPGSRGAKATITSAGPPSHRKHTSIARPGFVIGPTTITTSARSNTASFRQTNSAASSHRVKSCRWNATSRSSIKRPT